jgi:hypothetical protein
LRSAFFSSLQLQKDYSVLREFVQDTLSTRCKTFVIAAARLSLF